MIRQIYCQVLDCGDGVFGVTALALAVLKIPKGAADKAATPKTLSPQSKTLTRRRTPSVIGSHPVHGPDARPISKVEATQSARSSQPWAEGLNPIGIVER